MADLSRQELHQLARLGARARLEELRREEAAIRRAFPDLFGASSAGRPASADGGDTGVRRRNRGMTAAARRAVSERMKKYWAERRKSKKKVA